MNLTIIKEILALLLPALRGAAAFFQLRNKKFKYELLRESESRQKDLEEKIEKLRDAKDSNSALNADLLRKDLLKEKEIYEEVKNYES